MSQLVLYANLWTLRGHPSAAREWPLARKVAAIRAAGFTAFSGPPTAALRPLADRHGLRLLGAFSAARATEIAQGLRAFRALEAEQVNLQLADDFTPLPEAVRLAVGAFAVAEKLKLPLSIELHRDTCTETPEKLFALADAVSRQLGRLMPIAWDFSHFAVVKHLAPDNFAAQMLARPDLVQSASLFHLRPFNGHHIQVPVTWQRRLTPETRAWLPFAREVMRVWRAAPINAGREMFVCPELGPRDGYGLSFFPPVWPDAVRLRRELATLWP
ncbi:MAG TPA: hypothetical protein VM029_16535 [Opitutaceae bacterium]|nr:hypothetical protein [Opitutaceae bacterium]